jgi:hypothetical protein
VWTPAVHTARHIAVVAGDDKSVVSVASLSQPGVEGASATTDLTPMRCAIVIDVIEREKLNDALSATHTTQVSTSIFLA